VTVIEAAPDEVPARSPRHIHLDAGVIEREDGLRITVGGSFKNPAHDLGVLPTSPSHYLAEECGCPCKAAACPRSDFLSGTESQPPGAIRERRGALSGTLGDSCPAFLRLLA
jgi:hypothetical protein